VCCDFSGKVCRPLTDIELDLSVDVVGNFDDRDYFRNKNGFGKRFPGGPSCDYKGKNIPASVDGQRKVAFSTQILIDILSALDTLHIFDTKRDNGVNPFLLVDGHTSRLELPFLRYICDKEHRWAVVIDAPYGTALW